MIAQIAMLGLEAMAATVCPAKQASTLPTVYPHAQTVRQASILAGQPARVWTALPVDMLVQLQAHVQAVRQESTPVSVPANA